MPLLTDPAPASAPASGLPQSSEVAELVEAAQRLDAALATASVASNNGGVAWSGAGAYAAPAEGADPQLYLASRTPLPQALLAQYAYLRSRSFMGIFPDIHRAWFSIDSRLFLWSYAHPDIDIVDYQAPDAQIIVSVALVPPKPHMFLENISYLLVVTTPVSITVLGVSLPNGPSGPTCKFIETGITVATDNTPMLKVVALGPRIFLAGRDGALYELTYDRPAPNSAAAYLALLRSAASFATANARPRAKLVNRSRSLLLSVVIPNSVRAVFAPDDPLLDVTVDNSRNLLYTLSENGILTAYSANPQSEALAKIHAVDAAAHARQYHPPREEARAMLAIFTSDLYRSPGCPADEFGLGEQPSAVHLVLVTSLGERIYYSTSYTAGPTTQTQQSAEPVTSGDTKRTLRPVGWRMSPPVNAATSSTPVAPRAHVAFWRKGVLLLADARDADADTVVAVFPDAAATGPPPGPRASAPIAGASPVIEHISEAPLAASQPQLAHQSDRTYAKAWAMAEATQSTPSDEDSPFDPPREFVVLTNAAVHVYARLRPIDHLHRALARFSSPNEIDLSVYLSQYGPAEICAMSIALALEYGVNTNLEPWRDGGFGRTSAVRPPTPAAAVAAAAARAFLLYGGEPHLATTSDMNGDMERSATGNTARGVSLRGTPAATGYQRFETGRLVGLPGTSPPPVMFSPKYDGSLIHLSRLVRRVWQDYITSSRDPHGFQKLSLSKHRMIRLRESLLAYVDFVHQYSGATGAVNSGHFVPGHTVSIQDKMYNGLLHRRKTDEAQRFEASSTASLVSLARRSSEALALLTILDEHRIHTLIQKLSPELRAELAEMRFGELVVSARGSGVAGALLEALFAATADDSALVDTLGFALREKAPEYFGDADIALHRGLALIHQASRLFANQQVDNASSVASNAVRTLKPVAERIFDLPAVCAELRAMGAVPDLVELALAHAEQNPEGSNVAYSCIFEALKPVVQAGISENGTTLGGGTSLKEAALHLAMSSKDPEFLEALFRSLVSWKPQGTDELLRHSSPRIEGFLDNYDRDLLWRYYVNHDRNLEASEVLAELADTTDRPLDFEDRFNYVVKALHNAKAAEGNGDSRAHQQVRQMEDKMDVAQVQRRIREEMQRSRSNDADAQVSRQELDGTLYGLSELYNNFARPWQLWESELDALRCARYRDDALVRRLWADLIEQEISGRGGSSPVASLGSLGQRLTQLGRDFYPSDISFPATWILNLLESYLFRHERELRKEGASLSWAWRLFLEIRVDRGTLLAMYISLLEESNLFDSSEDTGSTVLGGVSWKSESPWLHLISVFEAMLEDWINLAASGRTSDPEAQAFRPCAGSAIHTLNSIKSRLRGMSHDSAGEHLTRVSELESKISRLPR